MSHARRDPQRESGRTRHLRSKSVSCRQPDDQEKVFAEAYLSSFDVSAAAAAAGITAGEGSGQSLAARGYRMRQRPAVVDLIRRRVQERLGDLEQSADDVLRELAAVAFGQPSDILRIVECDPSDALPGERLYARQGDDLRPATAADLPAGCAAYRVTILPTDLWSRAQRAAVTEIVQDRDGIIKIKYADKLRALEMLAKYHGLLRPDTTPLAGEGATVFIVPADQERNTWEATALKELAAAKDRSRSRIPRPAQ
jgi:hypothetical protein